MGRGEGKLGDGQSDEDSTICRSYSSVFLEDVYGGG